MACGSATKDCCSILHCSSRAVFCVDAN
ncbi:MAG: hypothetical protein AB8B50_13470 [Pirellulaceae bacterium]